MRPRFRGSHRSLRAAGTSPARSIGLGQAGVEDGHFDGSFECGGALFHLAERGGGESFAAGIDHTASEFFLGTEMEVERALGNTRLVDDLVEARIGVASRTKTSAAPPSTASRVASARTWRAIPPLPRQRPRQLCRQTRETVRKRVFYLIPDRKSPE